jgi:hypothetical protein
MLSWQSCIHSKGCGLHSWGHHCPKDLQRHVCVGWGRKVVFIQSRGCHPVHPGTWHMFKQQRIPQTPQWVEETKRPWVLHWMGGGLGTRQSACLPLCALRSYILTMATQDGLTPHHRGRGLWPLCPPQSVPQYLDFSVGLWQNPWLSLVAISYQVTSQSDLNCDCPLSAKS